VDAVFDLWRIRRGRRAAVASIRPFVEASRCRMDGIAEGVWLEPYMVGFVGTLVTLAAGRRSAGLGTQAMGLVQADAWADITGSRPDLIGEEICFLSAARSKEFETGCRNAARFFGALSGEPPDTSFSAMGDAGLAMPEETEASDAAEPYGDPDALWSAYFDAHVERTRAHWPSRDEL
jgi:hypothetical protein